MITINKIGEINEVTFKETQKFTILVSEPIKGAILKLFEQPCAKVLINMDGIRFIDSSGFAVLFSLSKAADTTGGQIIYCNVSDTAASLFKVLQLYDSFLIVGNREEALSLFK
jgi:anti-anti-sigma factor